MNTTERISQYNKYIEDTTKTLARAKELKSALQSWNKNIINKTFFEHYFTRHNADGSIAKDWRGKVSTNFHFCGKQFSFEKYSDRIYLTSGEYLEVQDKTTQGIAKDLEAKITILENRITNYKNEIAKLSIFDEEQFIKDINELYIKHGKPANWIDLLDLYEVKYNK